MNHTAIARVGVALIALAVLLAGMQENSRLTQGKPLQPETLTICTQIRDESPYVVEWIEHNLNMGATKIVIYDDGSKDNLTMLEGLYRQTGRASSVEVRPVPGERGTNADNLGHCPFCLAVGLSEGGGGGLPATASSRWRL